jgi:hypothetical protein
MTEKMKIEFAPGCFDDFEGTQEELDQLMADIVRMVEDGSIHDLAIELDEEESDELLDEYFSKPEKTIQ